MSTRWALPAPLARIPAVIPGSWPLLGTFAIAVAIITQAAILARENLPVGESLVVSLLAVAFGLVGAKVWYAVLHPGPWRRAILGGWAVDGFLAVCFAVGVAALLAFHLPVGAVLDATAPGLFFAVALGRIGCFPRTARGTRRGPRGMRSQASCDHSGANGRERGVALPGTPQRPSIGIMA